MFFIVNKFAQGGLAYRIFTKKILPVLKKKAPSFGFQITSSREEAVTLSRRLVARKEEIVVICGGDGSINALIKSLSDTETALGILPLGSSNDFALASLGTPSNPVKALHSILDGTIRMVDVGVVQQAPFINVFGIGIDAGITHLAHKHSIFRRMPFKELRYGFPLIQELQNQSFLRVKIVADKKIIYRGDIFFLSIYNGKREGSYFYLNSGGDIDDGVFDGTVIENLTPQQRLHYLIKTMRGDFKDLPALHRFRGRMIKITIFDIRKDSIKAQVDGDPILLNSTEDQTTLTVINKHSVLHLLYPKQSHFRRS